MAGPVSIVLKKLILDLFTDPEEAVKFIVNFILIPLLAVILILVLPIILILSVPSLLLDGGSTPELTAQQLETIAIYQNAPITINQENLSWIEDKKREYSWCDDIRVTYDFDLVWQHIMAIDSVILEQNFLKTDPEEVLKIGRRFLVRDNYVETYQVRERRSRTRTDKDGNTYTEHYYVTVTKYRGIIKISTKPFDRVINEIGFNDFEKNTAINIYNSIVSIDVEGNLNIYDDIDLSNLKEYPPGNASIPYFNQTDKRWGAYSYGNSTIFNGGCGPTSLAMVVAGLTGRSDINPKVVADWSVANGHRAEGQGSYWSLMTDGGRNYGLKVEAVSRKNPNKIIEALSKGYPVVVSMGRGHFTNGGHFIVLRGLTKDGKILVYDPVSVSRSQKAWDIGIIMNESSTNGGVNGSPFWIFKK